MRTIASTSGAHVTGITINDYQVKRAKHHNSKVQSLLVYHYGILKCAAEGS